MTNHSKQGVRNTELKVLDDLHVVRRDNDADVAEPGHLAPIKAGQPYAESIRFACHLKGQQDIGRASAPAYPKRNIAGLNEVAQLLGKHLVIGKVIRPGGNERYVVS